jgi:hypothetical protein
MDVRNVLGEDEERMKERVEQFGLLGLIKNVRMQGA